MLAMLDRLRELKAAGRDLHVVAFVPGDHAPPSFAQTYYELAMAQSLSEMAQARPDALNLVLVGRYHAAKLENRAFGHLPAGEVRSVTMNSQGGAAWFCSSADPEPGQPAESVCRATPFGGTDDSARGVALTADEPGFDGTLALGPVTASPPAIAHTPRP
jgi:hypothetical protein